MFFLKKIVVTILPKTRKFKRKKIKGFSILKTISMISVLINTFISNLASYCSFSLFSVLIYKS